MNKTVILFGFILLNTLSAEELTLHEAMRETIGSHPDIKSFMLQTQSAKEGINIAKADFLPQVSLNAEYDLLKTYVLPSQSGFNTVEDTGWQTSLNVRQKIWDFSKTTAMVEASKRVEEMAELSLEEAKSLLIYQVTLQYELAKLQKEAWQVAQEDFKSKEALYAQSQALFRQGLKTKADSSRIHASLLGAKDAKMVAYANYKKVLLTLSSLMGRAIEEPVEFVDPMVSNTTTAPSVEEIIDASLTLKRLAKEVEKNQQLYQASKRLNYGSIDAVASYVYQDTLNSYDSKLVGVTYTVPLYTGARNQGMIAQSKINQQRAKLAYDKEELSLREEAQKLLLDLQTLEDTIRAREAQIRSSQATKRVMEARYKNGLATYIEVLDASKTLLDAKLGLLQARYTKSSTFHRLAYLKGETL